MDDDIGADECRWIIEYDCWCDTGDDDDRWMHDITHSVIHPSTGWPARCRSIGWLIDWSKVWCTV